MAHVRQEGALGAVRRFGGFLGYTEILGARRHFVFEMKPVSLEFAFGVLAFGDVLQGADQARLRLATVLATLGSGAQVEEARALFTTLRDADSRDGLSDLARLWLLHLAPRS